MSGQAIRRRDHRVAYARKFRVFSHEFRLVAEDADMGRCLDYLVQRAEQDFPAHVLVDIRIETDNGGHRAFVDGELLIAHVPVDRFASNEIPYRGYVQRPARPPGLQLHRAEKQALFRTILSLGMKNHQSWCLRVGCPYVSGAGLFF